MLLLRSATAFIGSIPSRSSAVFLAFLFGSLLLPLFFANAASAQGTRRSPATIKQIVDTEDKPFEDQFWKYLIGNNYKNWCPGPSQTGDFYTGQNPHGALLKMYLNRTAAGRTQDFPMGSVIILENYRADKSLKTVSVMYRTSGFNPEGNDWYWVEYNPDGTVVKSTVASDSNINNVSINSGNMQKTMGRASNCISCHQSGEGVDFVFFNDKAMDGLNPSSIQRMADKSPLSGAR